MNTISNMAQLDLLAADVPDPTDFPPSDIAPGLRLLDEALRCSVCHELYDAPVTLNCGHCFCSLCVRNCLKDKEECPSCRKQASDTQLRKNVALESAVKAWAAAREFTLRLAKQEVQRLSKNALEEIHPRKRRRSARTSGGSSSDEVEIVEGPSTLAIQRRQPVPNMKKQRSNKSPRIPDTPSTPPTPGSSDDLIDCPVCQQRVPFQIINQHIDSSCKLTDAPPPSPRKPKGKAKQEWSKILGGAAALGRRPNKERDKERVKSPAAQHDDEPEYLPTVSYHTLKDRRVQELLNEHGLPTTGDRHAWVRRHQKWVTLYNANLDRTPSDRHMPDQLRRELQKWEASEGAASGGGSAGLGKKKAGEVTDVVAYQTAHKAEFAKLVEAARPKRSPQASQTHNGRTEDAKNGTGQREQSNGDVSTQAQGVADRLAAG
ncbi:uncharacterized protein C8Q71DRAFT_733395 [Rhodofomes roseus]|uniref:Postreplication repair E3 ubiquitin-protein ligase RAD18 n=1 Tax=Rhodofomes roseus TaxID=34475 RepID=A0ABQ8KTZ6_9APHY|nr:uncharacterized protein C8Q71DRAFT_733395 [Rhodofomes roseus]KAH9842555.1 hypothetical protein C8Q71DRAFT_733395 [Rhodofomes roseus]